MIVGIHLRVQSFKLWLDVGAETSALTDMRENLSTTRRGQRFLQSDVQNPRAKSKCSNIQ